MATPSASSEGPAQEYLFGGADTQQPWRRDPDRIRRRLEGILDAMRAEQKMAWDFAEQLLYQTIFPDMTQFLATKRARAIASTSKRNGDGSRPFKNPGL